MLVSFEAAWEYFIWEIQRRNCNQNKENISILIFKISYAVLIFSQSNILRNIIKVLWVYKEITIGLHSRLLILGVILHL